MYVCGCVGTIMSGIWSQSALGWRFSYLVEAVAILPAIIIGFVTDFHPDKQEFRPRVPIPKTEKSVTLITLITLITLVRIK